MKKLFVLALLGLGLGGGVWKAQNPDGTVDTFRTQATAQVDRLKAGVDAVLAASPATGQQQNTGVVEQSSAIDALTDRLASLESETDPASSDVIESVASLQTGLVEVQSSLKDAVAGNDAGNIRLDAIDSRLELLVRRLDEQGYDSDIDELGTTLAELQANIDGMQESHEASISTIDNQLANVSEQIESLGLRLDTLAAVTTVSDQQSADGDDSQNLPDSTATLALAGSGLDERFTALEDRLQTVNSDSRKLVEVTEQLTALQSSLTELTEQTNANSQSLNRLSSTVDDLETAGESMSIDTVQAEIRDQLALVQSQFESDVASDNTDALEGLLDTTRTRIQALEQRVQDLPAASTEASNAQQIQSALESQIVALERRLESINGADPELASTLSNVQEKVDELEARGFVTQDDLKAQNETRSVEYKIYFDRNSAEVTEDARVVLDSFIAQEKNRTTGVSIFGFTDRRGSATYNQQLALQRATNVRSYLIQNGFDYTTIKALTGLGEDAAAAVLPDNADDAQQRVVVLYSAQP